MVASDKMTKEEYQIHMDALAMRVSKTMAGERLEDALSAYAACIGFGMLQLPPHQHDLMHQHIGNIIGAIIKNGPQMVQPVTPQ